MTPTVTTAPLAPDPLPLPRVFQAGMGWSGCTQVLSSLFHKQEFAAALVPPEYHHRVLPGNVGTNSFRVLTCEAVSVGNATYFESVAVAFYSVLVRAPDGLEAIGSNYYLLEVATDHRGLLDQLRDLWPFATLANITFEGARVVVTGENGLAVTLEDLESSPEDHGESPVSRLHWKTVGQLCHADVATNHVIVKDAHVMLVAEGGAPATVAGAVQRMVGSAAMSEAGGVLGPHTCVAGADP